MSTNEPELPPDPFDLDAGADAFMEISRQVTGHYTTLEVLETQRLLVAAMQAGIDGRPRDVAHLLRDQPDQVLLAMAQTYLCLTLLMNWSVAIGATPTSVLAALLQKLTMAANHFGATPT